MTEPTTPEPRMRIRWGWIVGCIVLGLAGIAAGFLLVASADRTAYVASVLAGVGTTLLLVGIVVLLERRIVNTAAKAVRRAVDAEREASDARIERLVGDLEDRLSAEWARTGAANVDAMKRRTAELTDETVARIVDEAKGLAEESKRDAE
jgi:membrane protein implicated in regulation of membrane protease activity